MSHQEGGRFIRTVTGIRSIVSSAIVVVYTVICAIFVMTAGFLGQQSLATILVRHWCATVLLLYGIRVEVTGEENVPWKGGGILVFNHQSHFDIPAIVRATTKHIRFGAKIELFKIPFFGPAMRAIGTLPIARENRTEVLKIYKEAEKRFQKDFIFVLAPEGTRQQEPQIGRFKKGPFMFAKSAGVPIIPVVIRGAHAVLPKNSLGVNLGRWTRTVHLRFLPPFETRSVADVDDLEPFIDRVRTAMVETYAAMPNED